jgi:hypothetical protein
MVYVSTYIQFVNFRMAPMAYSLTQSQLHCISYNCNAYNATLQSTCTHKTYKMYSSQPRILYTTRYNSYYIDVQSIFAINCTLIHGLKTTQYHNCATRKHIMFDIKTSVNETKQQSTRLKNSINVNHQSCKAPILELLYQALVSSHKCLHSDC